MPEMPLPEEADFDLTVRDERNICTFTPNTESGARFLRDDLVSESWQWLGGTLCLDYRMAQAVINGARGAGLCVEFLDGERRIKNPPEPEEIA